MFTNQVVARPDQSPRGSCFGLCNVNTAATLFCS
jgi:hypothetical protein